ncbi:MAG: hypothetical protein O9284_13050 [Steroidobacteraceae bacterium]|jgi:hypothetical protein|nr:hypothetical protein [Steroidobacteraceae bacterium]
MDGCPGWTGRGTTDRPDDLKQRLAKLARSAGQTPHAFMVETLKREAERAELRARFAQYADVAEREALTSGRGHALDAAFDYLEQRVAGRGARRPRARSWRASS